MPTPQLADLLEEVESVRRAVSDDLDADRRAQLGQFLTPLPIAQLMASMFTDLPPEVRLLDPGAGVGSLTAAAVADFLSRPKRPDRINVVTYEIDPLVAESLHLTLKRCSEACDEAGVEFSFEVVSGDFIEAAASQTLLAPMADVGRYTHAILNPPYFKIAAGSKARRQLQGLGVEVPNMYAAFMAGAVALLEPEGELVAITPRSFCNGTYFRSFRSYLLDRVSLRRIHIFESRAAAFRDAAVLQENIIIHGRRSSAQDDVTLTSTAGIEGRVVVHQVPATSVVNPADPERFIHIEPDEAGQLVAEAIQALPATLADLGLRVSTGPVVDFRAREYLRDMPDGDECVPLIYPTHLVKHAVAWPKPASKKPNALVACAETAKLLIPDGNYVLVKRFSAKEERRRVVATVLMAGSLGSEFIGLENHLNYFHEEGVGLAPELARGLALYLNSTALDTYFRRFSGHTQVNATDLRNIRYPARGDLERVGATLTIEDFTTQERIDAMAADYYGAGSR